MCNIPFVFFVCFLRGHIEAVLTIGRHHGEIAILCFFLKVDFCNIYTAKSMILNWTMKNNGNYELSVVQKPFIIYMCFCIFASG